MPVDLLEKLVLFFTLLAVALVAACVVVLSTFQVHSGIPEVAVASELSALDWLDNERLRRHGASWSQQTPGLLPVVTDPARAPGRSDEVDLRPPTDYFHHDPSAPLPPQEAIEHYPWLRRVPGLTYHRPRRIPRLLHEKCRSLEDAYALSRQGSGAFVRAAGGGTAYRIDSLDPNSLLARRLGLREGDRLISVNGFPLGESASATRALYEQLRSETRFAVLIERQGQRQVLSYFVE